jgi:hypothetical protein
MSRNAKIAVAIVGGIVLLCICMLTGAFLIGGTVMRQVGQSISVDADDLQARSAEIVDFSGLPQDFKPEFGMSLMGITSVGYSADSSATFIMLMQFSPELEMNSAAMEQAITQAFSQQTGATGQTMELVEEIPVTIRGQATTLRIFEGESSGENLRQATAAFEGKGGPAILMIGAPVVQWDQALVDQIIAAMD